MKWSEGLSNWVSIIIRRYTDHKKFHCFFHIIWVPFFIIVYMAVCFVCFCSILQIMYSYCYICSVLFILFHCVLLCIVLCKCVLYYCHRRLPTGWTVLGSNPGGARFSAPVQTGPEAHPASCTMGIGSFPELRCGRGVTLTPHPVLVQRSKIE